MGPALRRLPKALPKGDRLAEPPLISGPLVEDISVLEGQNIALQCDFTAEPPPSIAWTKDGLSLPDRAKLVSDDRGLYIPGAQREDAGTVSSNRLSN